jgi:hypothetical protein
MVKITAGTMQELGPFPRLDPSGLGSAQIWNAALRQ